MTNTDVLNADAASLAASTSFESPRVSRAANHDRATSNSATTDLAPVATPRRSPDPRIRHSPGCSQRSPLLPTAHTLDDGRQVPYHRCGGCAGTDPAAVLVELLDRHNDRTDRR
jgi:hypothetical protein